MRLRAILPRSDWVVSCTAERKLGTKVNASGTSITAGSTTQRLPPEKAVRMGDKAKPLAAYRRRLCCLSKQSQYKISKIKFAISMIAVTARDGKH
jgi:hypothetical protein